MLLTLALAAAIQDAEWFPLKDDHRWTYETGDGKESVKADMGESKVGDKTGRSLSGFGQWEVFAEAAVVAVTKEGVTVLRLGKAKPDLLWVKFPLKAGDTWTSKGNFGDVMVEFTFATAAEEEIEVPAGKYKAFKVTATFADEEGTKGELVTWYAKGVGEVRSETTIDNRGKKVTIGRKLKKFETEPRPADLTTPKGTVEAFFAAVRKGNKEAVYALMTPAWAEREKSWDKSFTKAMFELGWSVVSATIREPATKDDTATVSVRAIFKTPKRDEDPEGMHFTLVKKDGKWLIDKLE
jgi:hypothetical protein